jgi:hypothetical protein
MTSLGLHPSRGAGEGVERYGSRRGVSSSSIIKAFRPDKRLEVPLQPLASQARACGGACTRSEGRLHTFVRVPRGIRCEVPCRASCGNRNLMCSRCIAAIICCLYSHAWQLWSCSCRRAV